jgi:hypothetical protein
MRRGRIIVWIVALLCAVLPLAQAKKGSKKMLPKRAAAPTKKEPLFLPSGNLEPGKLYLMPCVLGTQKGIQASNVPQKNVRSRTMSCTSSIDHWTRISMRVTCAGANLENESAEYTWANEFIIRLTCPSR